MSSPVANAPVSPATGRDKPVPYGRSLHVRGPAPGWKLPWNKRVVCCLAVGDASPPLRASTHSEREGASFDAADPAMGHPNRIRDSPRSRIGCVVLARTRAKRYDWPVLSCASTKYRRFVANLVVLWLLAVATTATASNDVDAVLDEIYHEQDIQRQLPIAAPVDLPSIGVGIPAVFGWLILAGVALGAAALALWLMAVNLDAVGQKRRKRRAGRNLDDASPEPGMQVPGDWLETADNLARQGRFAEAVHLLLLGVLGLLRVADGRTSEAETAREIARAHVGPHAGRLHALVRASELVHFGGRSATQEQFDGCRRDAVEIDAAARPAPA